MKAYLNNDLIEEIQPIYFYLMDRFFSDWKEEYRIGWEVLWEDDPILDAIMIYMTYSALNKIGLEKTYKIRVNSLWIEKEKIKYTEELINFYSDKKHLLTEKWLEQLETNPILLLLSKNEDEVILAQNAPKFTKFLKKDSKVHYWKFIEYLELLNIPYIEDHTLVSDKSYNTNTIWSFDILETWESISRWARYNYLSKELW
jgi:histidyl-tRNA synthetase